ncbi:hypothetical protein [Chloracidobacterium thermophilum]|nr:hypothetical protein [Chloracidobacterium thermophilum]
MNRKGHYQIVESNKGVATIAIYETHREIVITGFRCRLFARR